MASMLLSSEQATEDLEEYSKPKTKFRPKILERPPAYPPATPVERWNQHTDVMAFIDHIKWQAEFGGSRGQFEARTLIWKVFRDSMGYDAGNIPDWLAYKVTAYKLQIDGYCRCNLPIPKIVTIRYEQLLKRMEEERRMASINDQIEKLNEAILDPNTKPVQVAKHKKALANLIKDPMNKVKDWEVGPDGVAVKKVAPVKIKPGAGVSLKPGKKNDRPNRRPAKPSVSKAEKEKQYKEWEKAGGRRITVPAHDEKVGNKVIHHAEYSYVLPPPKKK